MTPTEADVIARAKQLFEEETGHPWIAASVGGPKTDLDEYVERARVELSAIDEEGHS